MSNYYFVASAIPPLSLDAPPDISFHDFTTLLNDNLTSKDMDKVAELRMYFDILNIRSFWKKEELDPRGNFDEVELEEALLAGAGFPDYVYEYLSQYQSMEDRLKYFPLLIEQYFRKESQRTSSPFIREYLDFERKMRLVLVGFRAKRMGRDLAQELQFEDPNEDFVAQLMAQKDAKIFFPPEGFEELQPIFEEYSDSPLELYKAFNSYRFNKIESLLGTDLFSIDRILGYMEEIIILENWNSLNQEMGNEILNKQFG